MNKFLILAICPVIGGCKPLVSPNSETRTPPAKEPTAQQKLKPRQKSRSEVVRDFNSPQLQESERLLREILRGHRGKATYNGERFPMTLKVGDPVERLHALFPTGPNSVIPTTPSVSMLSFMKTEPYQAIYTTFVVDGDVALAIERKANQPKAYFDEYPPIPWSKVPAVLKEERIRRTPEKDSAVNPKVKGQR